MGHDSVSGAGGHSSSGSGLDFASYWADKTVKEAVLQGQQLREQKAHLPSRDYNYVNIDFIKPPQIVKSSGRCRKKSPKVKPQRSKSPNKKESPLKIRAKEKKQKKPPCGMRIAELAVPTKRHCLDTWKNKCHTLPDYMIERLRHHVTDQRPVVQISEAIYCFKRNCKRQNKNEKPTDKTAQSKRKKIKGPLRKSEVNVLGAIFGYRVAKKLIVPLNISLNSDLEKFAAVISYDIEALMKKTKNIDTKTSVYKLIERDIVKKITIWVSNVLEETSENILEDQLKEFEEEAGPALDCIDDLVDNVLEICIPVPETFDDSYTSESHESGPGEGLVESKLSIEEIDLSDENFTENIEDHFKTDTTHIINNIDKKTDDYYTENIDDYFKKAIIQIINYIDKIYDNVDELSDVKSKEVLETNDLIENVDEFVEAEESVGQKQESNDTETTFQHTESQEYIEFEVENLPLSAIVYEQAEDVVNDIDQRLRTEKEALENDQQLEKLETGEKEEKRVNEKDIEFPEYQEINDNTTESNSLKFVNDDDADFLNEDINGNNDEIEDTYIESEHVAEASEINENNDDTAEAFIDAAQEIAGEENPILSEDWERKVTFGESAQDETKLDVDLNWKASLDRIDFAEPNEGLLSDADELWPEDVQPPVIRPSQSVSKSITSLGRIREVEEKTSDKADEVSSQIERSEEDKETEPTELNLEVVDKITPVDQSDVIYIKSIIIESIKSNRDSKMETASKDSGKSDKRFVTKKISDSKKGKFQNKKLIRSPRQRSPSRSSKIDMSKSPTSPVSKSSKNIKDKNIKSKNKDIESVRSSKIVESNVKTKNEIEKFFKTKPKPDYRVNFKTAPGWINRNFSEPSCSCVLIPSKSKGKPKVNENLVRRWCQDLEQGYENLKMWNQWVENTTRTVSMLQREIGNSYCPERCSNKEWMKLKRNIDRDASLWTKLNQHTQERLKSYKRMYQKPNNTPSNYIICCSENI